MWGRGIGSMWRSDRGLRRVENDFQFGHFLAYNETTMVAIKAHFDGAVFIPDEPTRLGTGERYVVLQERDFLELQQAAPVNEGKLSEAAAEKFREVIPVKTGGMPASEMLIRDRR
jgi:hypothetical protein